MSQEQPTLKVLRIGVVLDGKIAQERLVKAGDPVTIGESDKNLFVVPPSALPKRHTLFVPKGKGYALQFTEEMNGKISYKNAIVSLDQLKERGDAIRKGNTFTLPLAEDNRGKVGIDGITILFQFVPAPPEPLKAATTDFRPKLFEEDDPVFLGFLSLFMSMAGVLGIMVYTADPLQPPTLEDISEEYTRLIIQAPEEAPDKVAEADLADEGEQAKEEEPKEEEPKEEQPKEEQPKQEQPKEVAEAERQERARDQVMQESSLLMALIGTTGDASSGNKVKDLFADEDWGGQDLDAALQNVSGAQVASGDDVTGVRSAQGGGEGSADIGDLAKAGTGGAAVGAGPSTAVEGVVTGGDAQIAGAGDQGAIQEVIRRYRGQIKYCYDGRLKENPSLQGRVDVQFTIGRGRVLTAAVIGNSTGDGPLGDCIVNKVMGWRFEADVEADVVYPFILAL